MGSCCRVHIKKHDGVLVSCLYKKGLLKLKSVYKKKYSGSCRVHIKKHYGGYCRVYIKTNDGGYYRVHIKNTMGSYLVFI